MGRPFCRERWIRHAQEANESWRQLPVFMQVILVQVQGPWPELYLHRKQLVLQLPSIRIPLGNIGNILGTVGNIRGTLGTILTSKTLKRSTNFQTTPPILPQRPCCVWSNQQRRYENQDRTLVGAKTSKQKLGTHTHTIISTIIIIIILFLTIIIIIIILIIIKHTITPYSVFTLLFSFLLFTLCFTKKSDIFRLYS